MALIVFMQVNCLPWKKVAVVGVGSELNGDDRAGILVAEKLKKNTKADVYVAGQAPENFTHLSKGGYSHIIIIDATHFGGKPGEIRYFEGGKFVGEGTSTHKLPLKLFIEYLQKNCKTKIIIAGIEPKTIGFVERTSAEVEEAIEKLSEELEAALKQQQAGDMKKHRKTTSAARRPMTALSRTRARTPGSG